MILTKLYSRLNERTGGKGAVPVTNIDVFSRKSSLLTPGQCQWILNIAKVHLSSDTESINI